MGIMEEVLQEIVRLQDSAARDWRLSVKYDQLEKNLDERRERILEEIAYYDEYLEEGTCIFLEKKML